MSRLRLRLPGLGLIAQPTLTNFSALGTAPMVLMGSTTDYVAGMRGQLQISTVSNFASLAQNQIFFIDGASWASNSVNTGINTPTGTFFARWRILQDNESGSTITGNDPLGNALSFSANAGPWSASYTDTINVSVAALNTVTGTNKNSNMSVSGSPALTFTGSSGVGSYQAVRATLAATSAKVQLEVTLNVLNGTTTLPAIGFENGTDNMSSLGVCPGNSDANGMALRLSTGEIKLHWNTDGNSFTFSTTAGVWAVGDILVVRLDSGAHTMDIYRVRSGVETKIGGQATGIPTLTTYIAFAATAQGESGTFNFGATTFAKALDLGYAFYG